MQTQLLILNNCKPLLFEGQMRRRYTIHYIHKENQLRAINFDVYQAIVVMCPVVLEVEVRLIAQVRMLAPKIQVILLCKMVLPKYEDYLAQHNILIKKSLIELEDLFPWQQSKSETLPSGQVRFDYGKRQLIKGGKVFQLSRKENEIIKFLSDHIDRVVYTEELLDKIWDGAGAEVNVYMAIQKLRRKIEDDPSHPTFITTVRGGGYILNLNVIAEKEGVNKR